VPGNKKRSSGQGPYRPAKAGSARGTVRAIGNIQCSSLRQSQFDMGRYRPGILAPWHLSDRASRRRRRTTLRCRTAQAGHDTDQSVPRPVPVPVPQGARHRPDAGRHARGLAVGPGIQAAVAYLHGRQTVSFKRPTELCEGLFGLTISHGAISNMLARAWASRSVRQRTDRRHRTRQRGDRRR
jgi:hypothetical protein